MLAEREKELAEKEAQAAERAALEKQRAVEWQAELVELQQRRENMDQRELEKDCLSHFAVFDWLRQDTADEEAKAADVPEAGDDDDLDALEATDDRLELAIPKTPLGDWLLQYVCVVQRISGCCLGGDLASVLASLRSFGELQASDCCGLAESLARVLARTATEAESAIKEDSSIQPPLDSFCLSMRLDDLLQKYSSTDDLPPLGDGASTLVTTDDSRYGNPDGRKSGLSATEVDIHRAVEARVASLVPVLEDDSASTRLVVALAVLDVGSGSRSSSSSSPAAASAARPGVLTPLHAMSTADACWALCSEKRRLIVERMVPGVQADGQWRWSELRRTGIGWWLHGEGAAEQLDAVVTRIAQSVTAQLRKSSAEASFERSDSPRLVDRTKSGSLSRANQRLGDEAVFWYVANGTKLSKLRALLKTGVLRGDHALTALLEHQRSGEAQFMRKNAFRLLQLHRFHLAAALFLLCESHEDACQVVTGHLQDLQLAVVLARRQPSVVVPLLRGRLEELPEGGGDPWLRFLLAWHAGDVPLARGCAESRETAAAWCDGADPPLFDGALRQVQSSACVGLAQVVDRLLGPGS